MAKTNSELNIHEMVDLIAEAMLGDSRISIDKFSMTDALDSDLSANGCRRLSEEEIEQLVMGEDADGTSELERAYPHTLEEIQKYF